MVLTTIGYGAAGVAEKGTNFTHKLLLESGSFEKFKEACYESIGFTSDQGSSESGIANIGCRISSAADLTHWHETVR